MRKFAILVEAELPDEVPLESVATPLLDALRGVMAPLTNPFVTAFVDEAAERMTRAREEA